MQKKNANKQKITHPVGPQDGSVPVGHEDVLPVHEAKADAVVSNALLPLLELLQQLKVARYYSRRGN